MRAMVFAAGVGSRLKEYTQHVPKCLVPLVDGTTMLDKVIQKLKSAGVQEIIINLFHLGNLIEEHVQKQDNYGISILFSKEEVLLGTGGGLKRAQGYLKGNEPFFVHNSDIYSDINLINLYEAHKKLSGIATLACMERPTSRYLLFNSDKKLVGWENPTASQTIDSTTIKYKYGFSGIQVVSPDIFKYMNQLNGDFSIISAYLKAIEAQEYVYAHDIGDKFWIDMGTPEKLEELNKHIINR